MQENYRKKIIKTFTFLGGIYFFLVFVIPESYLIKAGIKQEHENISLGFIAIGMVAIGLGIINLLMIHGSKVIFQKKGWSQSVALLLGLLIMVVFSILDWRADNAVLRETKDLHRLNEFSRAIIKDTESGREGVPEFPLRVEALMGEAQKVFSNYNSSLATNPYQNEPEHGNYIKLLAKHKEKFSQAPELLQNYKSENGIEGLSLLGAYFSEVLSIERDLLSKQISKTFTKQFFDFLFEGLFVALGSALFSLLGVYIAAAAYRAFRIKTWEASLMMFSALIVMLGQISFGTWIYAEMPALRSWIMEIPNGAASRAITIGASVAGLVLAFRMWFSIESDSFSKDKKQ